MGEMNPQIARITFNYLLLLMGGISAGIAAYFFTGDPKIGFLIFSTATGLFGAILPTP